MTAYTHADALLHVAARAEQAVANMTTLRDNLPPAVTAADVAAWAADRLQELRDVVDAHRAALDVYASEYSTGLPVASVVALGAGWRWQHIWHPAPAQSRPGPLRNVVLPDGSHGSIVASAPGVLDVVRRCPGGA
jgi:hypothetical protein